MGCHFLLQGIFLTQGSNPRLLGLLLWQADPLPLSHKPLTDRGLRKSTFVFDSLALCFPSTEMGHVS